MCLAAAALSGCGPTPEPDPASSGSSAQGLCSTDPVPEGIDVSYASPINWSTVRTSGGKTFAYAKATDGTTSTLSQFMSNWPSMRSAGLTRGAYHAFYGWVDGVSQANYFVAAINAAGGLQAGDLPPAVDVEVISSNPAEDVNQLHRILDTLEASTGRVPVIYTSLNAWSLLGNPTGFERYPVWDAAWGAGCAPSIPNLPDIKIWQYLDNQSNVPGVSGLADLNKFNGSAADLAAWVGGSGGGSGDAASLAWLKAPPPFVVPGQIFRVKVTATNTGGTTWAGAGAANWYRLGATGGNRFTFTTYPTCGGYTNGVTDARVYTCNTISPGASNNYVWDVRSPWDTTSAKLGAMEVHDGVAWFGNKVTEVVGVGQAYCGKAATQCILFHRPDILPFYAANGWDTSCGNRNAIINNWCQIDPTGCNELKSGLCAAFNNSTRCTQGLQVDGTPIDPATTFEGLKVCGMNHKVWQCLATGAPNWTATTTDCL